MELSTHDVVTVPGDDVDTRSTLIIPDAHGLVIARGQHPGQFMMEEDRTHIINVTLQREHASLLLVIPDLHQTVVSS